MLRHTVDSISEKGTKHVEHRTAVSRLIPVAQKRILEALAKESESA